MLDLDNLSIPWAALVDGDSLKSVSGNIWTEIKIARRIANKDANYKRRLSIKEQIECLLEFGIYVMGETEEDNFEKVLKAENPDTSLPSGSGSKVLEGRWWAQNVRCPRVVQEVFDRIREIASSQSGNTGNLASNVNV